MYLLAVWVVAPWSNQPAFVASAVQIAVFGSNVILVAVGVALRSDTVYANPKAKASSETLKAFT